MEWRFLLPKLDKKKQKMHKSDSFKHDYTWLSWLTMYHIRCLLMCISQSSYHDSTMVFFKVPWSTMSCKNITDFVSGEHSVPYVNVIQWYWHLESHCTRVLPQFSFLGVFWGFCCTGAVRDKGKSRLLCFSSFKYRNNLNPFQRMKNKQALYSLSYGSTIELVL